MKGNGRIECAGTVADRLHDVMLEVMFLRGGPSERQVEYAETYLVLPPSRDALYALRRAA